MSGDTHSLADRFWPTPAAYALALTCAECGLFAWTCPCAVADNAATGMSDEPQDAA